MPRAALVFALGIVPLTVLHAQDSVRYHLVYTINAVDVRPARLSGPPVVYPTGPWRRQVTGRAIVQGIVDTAGRLELEGFEVVEVPDPELAEPVRAAMLSAQFSPGRLKGQAVRTLLRLGIELKPGPPPNPADLVRSARAQVAAGNGDSALALLDFVEDTLVRATTAVRAYARLLRGLALAAAAQDSLAGIAFDAGLAAIADLKRRGVDLAPSLTNLADSLRRARRLTGRATARSSAGAPTTAESVDRQPALESYPPIDYPPEMRALRVGGTVIVEVAVDNTGRPVPGTARVVQTPNPGLNAAALKVAAGAVYRPAVRGGRPVRVVVRQPITFAQ